MNLGKQEEFYKGFGEICGVIFTAKMMQGLSTVLSGGGTFDKLLMSPEPSKVKVDL